MLFSILTQTAVIIFSLLVSFCWLEFIILQLDCSDLGLLLLTVRHHSVAWLSSAGCPAKAAQYTEHHLTYVWWMAPLAEQETVRRILCHLQYNVVFWKLVAYNGCSSNIVDWLSMSQGSYGNEMIRSYQVWSNHTQPVWSTFARSRQLLLIYSSDFLMDDLYRKVITNNFPEAAVQMLCKRDPSFWVTSMDMIEEIHREVRMSNVLQGVPGFY